MKKIVSVSFLLSLLAAAVWFDFISCSNSSEYKLVEQVRIFLASPVSDKVEAKVFIEGYDGNIVNGAVVSVKDYSNSITILEYNFQKGCYCKLLDKSSSGEYEFTVNSRLFDSPRVYSVPCAYLEDTIDIKKIEMVNKIGENYRHYDAFNTSYPIRITWASAVDGCTYGVTIRTPVKVFYETSTNNKTIEVPENIIPPGSSHVYLQIRQQKSYGDIHFLDTNYYSVSVYSTGNISFNVL